MFVYNTKINEEHMDLNIKPQCVIQGMLATHYHSHFSLRIIGWNSCENHQLVVDPLNSEWDSHNLARLI